MRVDLLLNESPCLGVSEFGFRLAFKLRISQLNRDNRGQAFADVVTRKVGILVFEQALISRVLVDDARQCRAEALFVGAALGRIDRVRESVESFRISRSPLHGDLTLDLPFRILGFKVDDVGVDDLDLLRRIEVLNVVEKPSRVQIGHAAESRRRLAFACFTRDFVTLGQSGGPFIRQRDTQVFVEEGHLTETTPESLEIVVRGLEDVRIRPECLRRPMFVSLFTALKRPRGNAVFKGDAPYVPIAAHLGFHSCGERIDNRHTHAMQPSRHCISTIAEFSTGVQDRHNHFDGGFVFGRMFVDRDAAPIVTHPQSAVSQNRHFDVVANAGESFVDRIIDDLVDTMVKPSFTRRTDVHARTLTNRLESFEDCNRRGVVGLAFRDFDDAFPFGDRVFCGSSVCRHA